MSPREPQTVTYLVSQSSFANFEGTNTGIARLKWHKGFSFSVIGCLGGSQNVLRRTSPNVKVRATRVKNQ